MCSVLLIFLQMAWRQKVLPAVSTFMWVFPVRLLSLKPQDSALECMLLPRGVPNTGCPCGSDGKESACNAGDMSLMKGRSPGGGNGNPLWYSCLENSTWQATVHEVAKNQIQLSDSHTHTHTHTHRPSTDLFIPCYLWYRWSHFLMEETTCQPKLLVSNLYFHISSCIWT